MADSWWWRKYLTQSEVDALRADKLSLRERSLIAHEISGDLALLERKAVSHGAIVAAMDTYRPVIRDDEQAAIAAVRKLCPVRPESAPGPVAKGPQPFRVPFNEPTCNAIRAAFALHNKGHGEASVDYAESCAMWLQVMRQAGDKRRRSKWRNLPIAASTLKMRFKRCAKLGCFEALQAALPDMPVTTSERQTLDALAKWGISEGRA